MNSVKYIKQAGWLYVKILMLSLVMGLSFTASSQGTPTDSLPGDPGAMSVFNVQNLSFGAFSHGVSGGNITIAPNGTRSVSGSVNAYSLGIAYFAAIFDIEAPAGSIISILNGPNALLTGSNGGTMFLQIGTSLPVSPFNTIIPPPQRTPVSIGATLTVGNSTANPPGTYTGVFYVTFNLE